MTVWWEATIIQARVKEYVVNWGIDLVRFLSFSFSSSLAFDRKERLFKNTKLIQMLD
jgi:hypothetical protein